MTPEFDERILKLCAKAIAAKEQADISELRAALSKHIHRMREQVDAFPAPERRSSAAD